MLECDELAPLWLQALAAALLNEDLLQNRGTVFSQLRQVAARKATTYRRLQIDNIFDKS
ncbi:MAG: hypothetical protein JWM21_3809 [Acidobacteria bacterium]|nr:hypothetical protein [Acidobacteriota bacterium]